MKINYFKCLTTAIILVVTFTAKAQFVKENLGNKVNSTGQDASPVISPDGKTLFFYRDADGNDEIYFATKNPDNSWNEAKNIESPLNTTVSNEVLAISADGNTVYVKGVYANSGNENTEGISISTLTSTGWSDPIPVEFEVEPTWGWLTYLTLSSDENVMIFSTNGDLWFSTKKTNGKWAEVQKLPENINTTGREEAPNLAPDNKTLYFASDGLGGLGNMDVFKTTKTDDTWLNWTDPENLGSSVNSTQWDSRFSIDAKGEYAYTFSWENTLGEGDIFRIKLNDEIKPTPVVLIKGFVIDSETKKSLQANIRYENLNTGKVLGDIKTNAKTGEYTIILPSGIKYGFYANVNNYISTSENVDLTKLTEYKEITQDLYLTPIKKGETIRINNIFFDANKFELQQESFAELDRISKFLKDNPLIKVQVSGHTDNVGTDANNLNLSTNRAQSVVNYLIKSGIDKIRLSAIGYGKTKPTADNKTEEGKQKNRRVEFVIISN